ncbi:nuclear transport factor 2 family protein [Streptomyces sp. Ag109_G2-15]|uniref:nuclear transport factor 2 family protein n=1 Tax=Streptomyces sp. Ag109_G2-15 TaxID=1938850 RepID=UPI000BC48508|nr:nuclear transport factor 2 family protein [Streptomyces sp. Ag109_G2-15]SOD86586.1 SnoaL-like domain-containing protein [Streptomyces sp. Ag109_G2-15]
MTAIHTARPTARPAPLAPGALPVVEWADSFSLDGLDKFPGLYTEDAVAEDRSFKRTHRGRAQIRAWVAEYLDAVPEGSTAPTQAPTEGVRR